MLNARTQRIFFIWGAKKNVNAEKWKEHWWAGKSICTSSPLFKDEYPICIPIWIMFSSLYTRFSVRAYLRVNLVCDTNGSGDCKYYHIPFKTCLNDLNDCLNDVGRTADVRKESTIFLVSFYFMFFIRNLTPEWKFKKLDGWNHSDLWKFGI